MQPLRRYSVSPLPRRRPGRNVATLTDEERDLIDGKPYTAAPWVLPLTAIEPRSAAARRDREAHAVGHVSPARFG
jgi:hypothetical protein